MEIQRQSEAFAYHVATDLDALYTQRQKIFRKYPGNPHAMSNEDVAEVTRLTNLIDQAPKEPDSDPVSQELQRGRLWSTDAPS